MMRPSPSGTSNTSEQILPRSPGCPAHDEIDIPVPALGSDQSLTPIEDKSTCARPGGHLGGVGLDLMLAGFAPSGRVNRGYSDSPQRHRRAGLELQERSAAVAPVTTSLTSVSQGHGMPKRGHSCSSAGGLRSRYGLTPSFPGTLTRCFLTWPELLRPSIARRRSIEVIETGMGRPRTLSLFAEDRCVGLLPDSSIVRLKLSHIRLRRPRQWGACWLALELWRELGFDRFGRNSWIRAAPAGTRCY